VNHLSSLEVDQAARNRAFGPAESILVPLRCPCEECERKVAQDAHELLLFPDPADAADVIAVVERARPSSARSKVDSACRPLPTDLPPISAASGDRGRADQLTPSTSRKPHDGVRESPRPRVVPTALGTMRRSSTPRWERTLAVVLGLAVTASLGVLISSHLSAAKASTLPDAIQSRPGAAADPAGDSDLRVHTPQLGVLPQTELTRAATWGSDTPGSNPTTVEKSSVSSPDNVTKVRLATRARTEPGARQAAAARSTLNTKPRRIFVAKGGTLSESLESAKNSGIVPSSLPLNRIVKEVARFAEIEDPNSIAAGTWVPLPSDDQWKQLVPGLRSVH
jgi:hypothetical protein